MKGLDSLLIFLAGVVVGVFGYSYFMGERKPQNTMPANKQAIVLERISKVAKMITVEGQYANIHTYEDSYWGGMGMFSKKALVRVNAKVSVGFDLHKAQFIADEATNTIIVKNLPQPEILSIDHDLDFYNMQEGMFNSFGEKELTAIGDSVKVQLRRSVENSPLMQQAKAEGGDALEVIKTIVELSGWNFKIEYAPLPSDSLRRDSLKIPNVPNKTGGVLN